MTVLDVCFNWFRTNIDTFWPSSWYALSLCSTQYPKSIFQWDRTLCSKHSVNKHHEQEVCVSITVNKIKVWKWILRKTAGFWNINYYQKLLLIPVAITAKETSQDNVLFPPFSDKPCIKVICRFRSWTWYSKTWNSQFFVTFW